MKKIILLIVAIANSLIGVAQWQQTSGSSGYGYIDCFGLSGTKLFAGCFNGILYSTNNGINWSLDNTLPLVISLATTGNTIFAGCLNGVYASTNNGSNWYYSNNGLPNNKYVRAIGINGINIFAATDGGIFLSTDNGANWVKKPNGLSGDLSRALAINGYNIFAFCGGVYLSTNNGEYWALANSGMPGTSWAVSFAFIGNNIFAGTFGDGIYLSTNNGGNWISANNGLTNLNCKSVLSYGNILFAGFNQNGGVFMSTNNGSNWADVSSGLTNKDVVSLFINNGYIFAGTETNGSIWKRPLSEMIGINEITNKINFSITPNPAKDKITINLQGLNDPTGLFLTIYNIQGQLVLQQTLKQNNIKLDISQFQQGVYIAKILLKDGSVAQEKFVVV